MPNIVTLGPWLRRFLSEHVVPERNLARNAQKSYSLLLPFASRKLRKPVDLQAWISIPFAPGGRPWKEDKDLMAFLKSL
jgi:hypothetical protein